MGAHSVPSYHQLWYQPWYQRWQTSTATRPGAHVVPWQPCALGLERSDFDTHKSVLCTPGCTARDPAAAWCCCGCVPPCWTQPDCKTALGVEPHGHQRPCLVRSLAQVKPSILERTSDCSTSWPSSSDKQRPHQNLILVGFVWRWSRVRGVWYTVVYTVVCAAQEDFEGRGPYRFLPRISCR